MKRPVAVFGFTYLIALLAATRFSLAVIFPFTVALVILLMISFVFYKKQKIKGTIPAILLSSSLAFAMLMGYQQWKVEPIQRLNGQSYTVTARVIDAVYSNGGDTSDVVLQIIDGMPNHEGLKVEITNFPEVQISDKVETTLTFYALNAKTMTYNYANSKFVGARATGMVEVIGESPNFISIMRAFQYKAGDNIGKFLPDRLASVAAAMALGDTRTLPEQTQQAYRMAGLSHVLVVSGMHLSVLCGLVYELLLKRTRKIRIASVCCIAITILFMFFTGFTPSVVRSGITYLLLYTSRLFRRKADTYTSLGIAALLMCLQNPYAANDVGLLLSFSATIGAVQAAQIDTKLKYYWYEKPAGKIKKACRMIARLLISPLIVSIATLPILLVFGFGVSVLSLIMNVIALPFTTPIVLIGILLGALGGISWLAWLLKPFALIAGMALVILEKITEFCLQFENLYLYIGGVVAISILLLYPLGYLAYKTKLWKSFASVGLIIVILGIALNSRLSQNTVQVTVAGSGVNPSLVVSRNDECVILYRDRRTAWAIERVLQEKGIEKCVLFIDMRNTSQSTEYISMFEPEQTVVVNNDLISHAEYTPLQDTTVYIQKQGDGKVACIDIEGYRVGMTTGATNMGLYPMVDIFIAGSGKTENVNTTVLVNSAWPAWLEEMDNPTVLTSTGTPLIWVRPGESVLLKEVENYG